MWFYLKSLPAMPGFGKNVVLGVKFAGRVDSVSRLGIMWVAV